MRQLVFLLLMAISTSTLANSPIRLGLNWKAEPQFGGFYEAERLGLFKEKQLNIEILQGGSGTPTIQMASSGKLEFAIVSADEFLIAREKGSLLIALFAVYQTNPQAIMTHAKKNYASLEDVFKSDSTIALQAGLPYAQFISKKLGKDLKAKLVPYSGGISLFQNDSNFAQQCFFTSEPLLAQKQGLKTKVFLVSEIGYNPYTTVVVAKKSLLDEKPELVKKFVSAIRSGWDSYLKNPEPANALMAQLNPAMDKGTFTQSAALQRDLILTEETKQKGIGHMQLERWVLLKKQLAELKILKSDKGDNKSLFINL